MKNLWRYAGICVFWASWPVWWSYLSKTQRTRIVVIADGYILLVRGWIGGGDWQLPGGGLHKNESVITGALRELKEETSISLSEAQLSSLYVAKMTEYGITYNCHCLIAKLPKQLPLKSQKHEIVDIAWVPLGDIGKLRASKQLIYTLQRI